ncbi:C45 family peptidase [Glutamicibacter sp.]|uniref:C45 family peptidase n=1 Tax=Glutamicibacter sp. TaxID=1931995 RepID=UPI0028BDA371|nr:C45 family peptidase [Glutamicibacter sp.]
MNTSLIRLVEISGTPRQRGQQYGEQAHDLIALAINYYSAALKQQTSMDWPSITSSVLKWLPLCNQLAPHLVEEMRGIAEGADVSFEEILTLNLRGEFVHSYRAQQAGQGLAQSALGVDEEERSSVDGCTSFFLTGDASGTGHTLIGQNWDWRTLTAETTMVLRIKQDPLPTIVMQVEAGQVGRHGANSAGIALNANGMGGTFGEELGLPQTLIRRLVLDQSDLASALKMLLKTRPHIASNALLGHRSGFGIDVETTPHGADWIYPEGGLIAHANHYQASVPPQLAGRYRPASVDSLIRLPRVTEGLRKVSAATTPDQGRELVRAAMSDHLGYPEGVCTHPVTTSDPLKQWSTLLSSCVDLTTGEYHVAAGYPCETPYTQLPWNIYDGPGGIESAEYVSSLSNSTHR